MHRLPIKARFGELDPYNHVNHSVYVAWFEAGRCEALDDLGLGLHHMADAGFQIVVTDLAVRYRIPAKAGQDYVVETWLEELRGATSRWGQRLVLADVPYNETGEQTVFATAELRAGFCDANGRPTRIPAEARDLLMRLVATPLDVAPNSP